MINNNDQDCVYTETLPAECPPKDAYKPNGESYYRLVKTNPPTGTDFMSFRALNPDKECHTSECMARALSIFSNYNDCNKLKKLATHKNDIIVSIDLPKESGKIKPTISRYQSHHSWWLAANFNPIPCCQIA